MVQAAIKLPRHNIARSPDFRVCLDSKSLSIGSEEPNLIGATPMVDIRIWTLFPSRIGRKSILHVSMDQRLKVNTCITERANHHIRAHPFRAVDITIRITHSEIACGVARAFPSLNQGSINDATGNAMDRNARDLRHNEKAESENCRYRSALVTSYSI